jgi:predicted enzyme related to lactoylglutathione lyase
MTARPQPTPGAPCWIELLTADAAATRAFYADLFGWNPLEASAEFGGYFMFERDGAPVAGCMPIGPEMGDAAAPAWGTYLAVEDVRAAAEAAAGAGATVLQPAADVADLGGYALVLDPGGVRVGLWQAYTFAGFGSAGPGTPPGAPGYFELHTRDYDASVAFYRDVLRWNAVERTEVPGLRYTTLGEGDAAAGIMDATDYLGEGDQPAWNIYFATEDVDAALGRVERLGGGVRYPAMDTPFGRQATVTDPGGALFKLLGPAGG